MNCIKCKEELLEGSKFCDMCGAPQPNGSENCNVQQESCAAANVKNATLTCVKCNVALPEGSNFCDMCGAPQNSDSVAASNSAPRVSANTTAASIHNDPVMTVSSKSRTVYLVLGILYGGLGIHNFYAGRTGIGIAQLVLCWTGISSLWALIDLFVVKKDGKGCQMNFSSDKTVWTISGAAVALFLVLILSLNHIVYGIGCCVRNTSPGKASVIFARAAAMGNTNAMYALGEYNEWNHELYEAVKWYNAAAENDHVEAQIKLGKFYLNGFGSPEQAFGMFGTALDNDEDNIQAQYYVAYCKLFGIGTCKDANMAFKLFENIEANGEYGYEYDLAQVYLAHCYLNGEGVAKDVAKAVALLRKGINNKIPLASFLMARCYFSGEGVEQSYSAAAKLAKNAAVSGMVMAQNLLNECFKKGNLSWSSTKELQDYAAQLNMTVDDKRHLVKNNGYKPFAVIPYGVVAVEARAFSDDHKLQEVVIPASVKAMGNAVFARCENLKKVTVAGDDIDFEIDSIVGDEAAVTGDVKLKNLKEVWISSRAGFDGNTLNLVKLFPATERQKQGYDLCRVNSQGELLPVNRLHKTIIVPDGVVNLGCGFHHDDYLCRECRNRSCKSSCYMRYRNPAPKKCQHNHRSWDKYFGRIETVVLPESVEDLGGGFRNFTTLKKINIPGKVKEIAECAFENSGIENITLSTGIKKIGEAAFRNCDNLREITIPEGVTVIPENAFLACDRLAKVVIPDSVKTIEKGAFNGCPSLRSIEVSANTTVKLEDIYAFGQVHKARYKIIRRQSGYTAQKMREPQKEVKTYSKVDAAPAIRPAVRQPAVNAVADGAEYSLSDDGKTLVSVNKSISRFAIPEGVQIIGKRAFFNCQNLKAVSIPDNVNTIDSLAFAMCKSLESIDLPDSVEKIGVVVFGDCRSLESIEIPEKVRFISVGAFRNCTSLKQVVFPKGILSIGPRAFENCSSLKEVKVPASARIGKLAFPDTCKIIRY